MSQTQPKQDTIHIVVRSPYTVIIAQNTNAADLEVMHNITTRTLTIYDRKLKNDIITAILETDKHHDNGDQTVHSNGIVDLIIEYQMLYHS